MVVAITENLQSTLNDDNVLSRYEVAALSLYDVRQLKEACLKYIVSNTKKILDDKSFLNASEVSDNVHRNSSR